MKLVLFIFLFYFAFLSSAYKKVEQKNYKRSDFSRIMFYNVENLFDTIDDKTINDNDFLPTSKKYWNSKKYYIKINNIYRVIAGIGEEKAPEIIGLCEIENSKVIDDLLNKTPLIKAGYKYIHYDSKDKRGIDVVFIYQKNYFTPLYSKNIEIIFPFNLFVKTRDILYVKGLNSSKDTLHCFINHWPSRVGGKEKSEEKREYVADKLKMIVDSITKTDKNANIIIMGDFNDTPTDNSILNLLSNNILVNLMNNINKEGIGTCKYQNNWFLFDQIIVSNYLNKKIIDTKIAGFDKLNFLLEEDKKSMGLKPMRTYIGLKYNFGFSDHLPVYCDIKNN